MAGSLPRNIRLRLEQTLAQWRHWQCAHALPGAPRVVRVLAPGLSNFTVLVESGQRFAVRIDGIRPGLHGLHRQGEWRALLAASRARLSPVPRYCNPELGSLVCDYLEPDARQGLVIADVAALLRNIHRLPTRHSRLDLRERIARYTRQLALRDAALAAAVAPWRRGVVELLDAPRRQPRTAVLCHNDLLRANRIYSSGKLWALDWEYCATGSPWYDLAVVVGGDGLDTTQSGALLEAYLARTPLPAEHQSLQRYTCIYRYLELLWYLAVRGAVPQGTTLQRKLDELDDALAGC